MRTVWKYEIPLLVAEFDFQMPPHQWLSAGLQGERMVAWALVDPEGETALTKIRIVGTGTFDFGDNRLDTFTHIGTVQMDTFVWHIFEEPT